jgi:hypothetical protein
MPAHMIMIVTEFKFQREKYILYFPKKKWMYLKHYSPHNINHLQYNLWTLAEKIKAQF